MCYAQTFEAATINMLPVSVNSRLHQCTTVSSAACNRLYVASCRSWSRDDCGEKEAERQLLREYPKVAAVFCTLPSTQQRAIRDICKRMGAGMADFLEKEVETVADYDQYCHYVAGADTLICTVRST